MKTFPILMNASFFFFFGPTDILTQAHKDIYMRGWWAQLYRVATPVDGQMHVDGASVQ